MNRRENQFKKHLMKIMGTRWDAQSHEDKYSNGIPDLSFGANGVNGWIELKQIPKFKGSNLVKPDKYTPEQINWIKRRGKKAGHCFIFVKVDDRYFLFDWGWAREIAKGMTKAQYIERSLWYWSEIDPNQLIDFLTNPSFSPSSDGL